MDLSDTELAQIADDLGVDVAELQSEAVKDCAESIVAERDVDKSTAFAICQSMANEGKLQHPAHIALAEQDTPGRIERVEEADGSVRYKNLKLLGVGTWGDAATQRRFLYSSRTIKALADSIADDTLNLFHEQDNETTEVGRLDRESVFIGDDDALYGDIVLSMENSASEFADEALQDALESGGRQGLKGPSLEIADPDHSYNRQAGALEVVDGTITGLALVGLGVSPGPGSKDAAFAEQTRERAVALADADGTTVLTKEHDAQSMTPTIAEQLADQLDADALHALAEEHDIDLQTDGEMGMVQDLISQAANEGFDPGDQSVDELRSFIAENLDPSEDAMAAFDSVAGAVVDAMEADGEDAVAAEDMAEWIGEQMADGEAEEEPEDGEGDGEEMEMAEQVASLAERVDAIESALEGADLSNLQDTVTTLSEAVDARAQAERVDDLAEDVTALQETVSDIASNLEESSTLADAGGGEPNGAEDDRAMRTDFGSTQAVNRTY